MGSGIKGTTLGAGYKGQGTRGFLLEPFSARSHANFLTRSHAELNLLTRNGQSKLQLFELEFDQVQGNKTIKIIVPNLKSPAEIDPKIPDSRALGLAIQSLQIVR